MCTSRNKQLRLTHQKLNLKEHNQMLTLLEQQKEKKSDKKCRICGCCWDFVGVHYASSVDGFAVVVPHIQFMMLCCCFCCGYAAGKGARTSSRIAV